MAKRTYPLSKVYGLPEPGPVLLLTTRHKGVANAMTKSWHTMLELEPPPVGCVVSRNDFSFLALKASREGVLKIPTVDLAIAVVRCGNPPGQNGDKFKACGLTAAPASLVARPWWPSALPTWSAGSWTPVWLTATTCSCPRL